MGATLHPSLENSANLRRHFYFALLLALGLRLLCLYFVWGPQGLDDYLDNLIPAWKFTQGLDPDLHEYRGPLYMWILAGWLRFGMSFGIEKSISLIRWVYFLQTLVSLLAVYGVYRLVRRHTDEWAARASLYLVAAHAVMPFASTRSFMESFVIGFLTLAMAALVEAQEDFAGPNSVPDRKVWAGWILLGFSTLVRFQVGVIYLGWGVYLLATRRYRQLAIGVFFGLVLIGAEILIDRGYGRYGFQTLHDYYVFNQDQSRSGVMPWYNTWLTWCGALLVPFSLVMGRHWFTAFREYKGTFLAVMLYVVTHSIYPHKEERYLFPILALSVIFLARAWSLSRKEKLTRWIFQPFFWGFNTLALAVFCLVNTQVGLIAPLGETEWLSDRVLYLDYDHQDSRDWMSIFFVRQNSVYTHPTGVPRAEEAERLWIEHPNLERVALLNSNPDWAETFRATYQSLAQKYSCTDFEEAGSFTDTLLFRMNPKFNYRRRGTFFFSCAKR